MRSRLLFAMLCGAMCLEVGVAQTFLSPVLSVSPVPLSRDSWWNVLEEILYSNRSRLTHSLMHTASDGTISWDQPDDNGILGYNGRCGETAAANLSSMAGRIVSPKTVALKMSDITPGTLPSTLQQYLWDEAPGNWVVTRAQRYRARDTIKQILRRGSFKAANGNSPFAALLRTPRLTLHWVTVVDLTEDDYVVINHNGNQDQIRADYFIEAWGFQVALTRYEHQNRAGEKIATSCCYPFTLVSQAN